MQSGSFSPASHSAAPGIILMICDTNPRESILQMLADCADEAGCVLRVIEPMTNTEDWKQWLYSARFTYCSFKKQYSRIFLCGKGQGAIPACILASQYQSDGMILLFPSFRPAFSKRLRSVFETLFRNSANRFIPMLRLCAQRMYAITCPLLMISSSSEKESDPRWINSRCSSLSVQSVRVPDPGAGQLPEESASLIKPALSAFLDHPARQEG